MFSHRLMVSMYIIDPNVSHGETFILHHDGDHVQFLLIVPFLKNTLYTVSVHQYMSLKLNK